MNNNQQNQEFQENNQYVDQSSMDYNASQIYNYEENYDQSQYQNYYNSYYDGYTLNQAQSDRLMHQEMYQNFLMNYEEMKRAFPKKRKIVRWENEAESYNSLEAAEEFMDLLGEMQKSQEIEQELYNKQAKEFSDIYS